MVNYVKYPLFNDLKLLVVTLYLSIVNQLESSCSMHETTTLKWLGGTLL